MSFTIDASIRAWIVENNSRGCTAQSMIDALVAAGHPRAFAEHAVPEVLIDLQVLADVAAAAPPEPLADTLIAQGQGHAQAAIDSDQAHDTIERAKALAAERAAAPTLTVPEPLPHGPSLFVQTSDRRIAVLATLAAPRVIVLGGMLSHEECDELIALSASKLERSRIVDPVSGETGEIAERSSDGTWFAPGESALVARIDKRIAELMRWPEENGESLQILRYRPGGEYKPHFDYFDPNDPGSATHIAKGGNRVATLIIYLADVAAGGGTVFPDIGLEVAPAKGNAVFFSYDSPTPASLTLHGGAPVTAGEKWIATKWVRERAYR